MLRVLGSCVLAFGSLTGTEFVRVRSGAKPHKAARETFKAKPIGHKMKPYSFAQKRASKTAESSGATGQGYALGIGYCINMDPKNPSTLDYIGDHLHDCASMCRASTEFHCHGYAVGVGVCRLYASTSLQAQRPAFVAKEELGLFLKCYVMKQTFNADFPLIAVSDSDFIACHDGIIPGNSMGTAIETQVTSMTDYVHQRPGDAHAFFANFCARQCQRFRYFLLKSHVSLDGRGANKCFCVERYNHEKTIDRFIGDTYFGKRIGNNMCPTWDCIFNAEGCRWEVSWDKHVAIYSNPLPEDGDPCPDHQSAHEHQSSYMFVGGSNGRMSMQKYYAHMVVESPSDCAQRCFSQGPSVRGALDSEYNSTCHAYYVHRNRKLNISTTYADTAFDQYMCYLYVNPISLYETPKYQSYSDTDRASGVWNNYLCVLRTCIEDTPCAWNMHDNYRRVNGFRYTANGTRHSLGAGMSHCDTCATFCSGDPLCVSYQCSISTDHCYTFTQPLADSDLQVSDVSLCVKSSALPECSYQSGANAVLTGEDPCLCGGAICHTGSYCVVHELSGSGECSEECPCIYATTTTIADKVCGANNVTYASECEMNCANDNMEYAGACSSLVCNGTATGTSISGAPCSCTNSTSSIRCPAGSTCFANGTCTTSCDEYLASGETIICYGGIEYPSRCSIPIINDPGMIREGKCPLPTCTDGQTDCQNCGVTGEDCTSKSNLTTRCVSNCTSLNETCGCIAPCHGLESSNTGNTSKSEACGCDTTAHGYIVCDGHCFVNSTSGETSCKLGCPYEASCVCGSEVCDVDLCDTTVAQPICRSECTAADDTDCFCRAEGATHDTHFCGNGTLCSTYMNTTLNISSACVSECSGREADNTTCYCLGESSIEVCEPPTTFCSANNSIVGSTGTCVGTCSNGTSDCICGKDTCGIESGIETYCSMDEGKCFPSCATDGIATNCFCPSAEVWSATLDDNVTRLCFADETIKNSVANTYCTLGTNGTAFCEGHCPGTNGLIAGNVSCPCGMGIMCEPGQFCVHAQDADSGTCLDASLTEVCENVTSNELESLGEASVSISCWCGGMPCPEGSFCHSTTGTCSSTRIQECDVTSTSSDQPPCRCGTSDDVVCGPGEFCKPDATDGTLCLKAIVRCHDYPSTQEQSCLGSLFVLVAPDYVGVDTDCYCGQETYGGTICTNGTTCATDASTATCI